MRIVSECPAQRATCAIPGIGSTTCRLIVRDGLRESYVQAICCSYAVFYCPTAIIMARRSHSHEISRHEHAHDLERSGTGLGNPHPEIAGVRGGWASGGEPASRNPRSSGVGVDHAVSVARPAGPPGGETGCRQTLFRASTIRAVLELGIAAEDGMARCEQDRQ